jgi:hypothetical protein
MGTPDRTLKLECRHATILLRGRDRLLPRPRSIVRPTRCRWERVISATDPGGNGPDVYAIARDVRHGDALPARVHADIRRRARHAQERPHVAVAYRVNGGVPLARHQDLAVHDLDAVVAAPRQRVGLDHRAGDRVPGTQRAPVAPCREHEAALRAVPCDPVGLPGQRIIHRNLRAALPHAVHPGTAGVRDVKRPLGIERKVVQEAGRVHREIHESHVRARPPVEAVYTVHVRNPERVPAQDHAARHVQRRGSRTRHEPQALHCALRPDPADEAVAVPIVPARLAETRYEVHILFRVVPNRLRAGQPGNRVNDRTRVRDAGGRYGGIALRRRITGAGAGRDEQRKEQGGTQRKSHGCCH